MEQTTTEAKGRLQLLSKENGLSEEAVKSLNYHFIPFFEQSDEWVQKAKALQVTDASQVQEMSQAREARLALKKIRVNVEKTRKELKEDSLRKGKAIDGIAGVINKLIEPIEKHLQKQEDFIVIKEQEAREALRKDRFAQLSKYDFQYENGFNLGLMDEAMFDNLLSGCKKAHEDKIAAVKKEEEEKIEMERRKELHMKRKEEILPYWNFIPADKRSDDFSKFTDQEWQERLSWPREEKEKYDANQEKIKKENEALKKAAEKEKEISTAKLKKERDERLKVQAELKKKQEEEEKRKYEETEKKAREILEAKRLAKAPDKDKLNKWVDDIMIGFTPKVGADAHKLALNIHMKFSGFQKWAKEEISKL